MANDFTLNYQFWLGKISSRTYKALGNVGMTTVDDVCTFLANGGDLLSINKFGKKSLFEVMSLLDEWKRDIAQRDEEEERARKALLSDEELAKEQEERCRIERECALIEEARRRKQWEKKHPLCRLSAEHKDYIQRQYLLCAKENLSVRSFHFLEANLYDVERMMQYMGKPRECFTSICPDSSPKKTLDDIFAFSALLQEKLTEWTALDSNQLAACCERERYSFLTDEQCAFVLNYREEHGYSPFLYIVLSYIQSATDRATHFYRMSVGLEGEDRMIYTEIARSEGLSTERVRQIVSRYKLPEELFLPDEYKEHRAELFSSDFLTSQSSPFLETNEREHLGVNFFVFAKMLSLVADFCVVEEENLCVVVNNQRVDANVVSLCMEKMLEVLDEKRCKDVKTSADVFLENVPDEQRDVLRNLVNRVAEEYLHLAVDEEGIVLPKNSIDVGNEMEEILAEHGAPMLKEDIVEALKRKNPDLRVSEAAARTCLAKDDRFKNLGKQGRYGLVAWKHVYFGSLTQYILDMLRDSEVPLSRKEIKEKVSVHFPNATEGSIYSLMVNRDKPQVDRYRGDLLGLHGKTYPSSFVLEPMARIRTFEQQCERLRAFVETNQRFPFSDGDEEEKSIGRWVYCINHGLVSYEEAQIAAFQQLWDDLDKKGYPRTASEAKFVKRCEAFKEFVHSRHRMPDRMNDEKLYNWYTATCRAEDKLTGIRAERFSALKKYVYEELLPPQLF